MNISVIALVVSVVRVAGEQQLPHGPCEALARAVSAYAQCVGGESPDRMLMGADAPALRGDA